MSGGRKTIFITGAGSGIGRATAELFAKRGWFVGLCDVNAAGLQETQALIARDRQTSAVFDVRDRDGWSAAIGQFGDQTGGKMHVLFNNAGVARHGWFEDVATADADVIVDVNLKGVINGVYAALPLLKATPGARIVNTASCAGLYGSPKLAVYSATKFAVRGLTEALDVEFERHGVRVTSLMPWFTQTPMIDVPTRTDAKADAQAAHPVSMVAERAWDAAHGDDLHYTVGKEASRLRFAARFLPKALRKHVARSVTG